MEQLLLFQKKNENEESLVREVQRLKEQCENVRKGQFAKIGKLTKLYEENINDYKGTRSGNTRLHKKMG